MNLWRNFASCLAQMQSSKGPNTPKQEEAGKGKKKRKEKRREKEKQAGRVVSDCGADFFRQQGRVLRWTPKISQPTSPPPLPSTHRRAAAATWRVAARSSRSGCWSPWRPPSARSSKARSSPSTARPTSSSFISFPNPSPSGSPPPPISVLCHFRSPCCSCFLRLFLFPWRGRSQEGVGRAERGERRNVRVLKANYIREFSVVGKADDPLDPAGCVLDLAAIHAREEAALRCVTLPSRPCSTTVCSLSDVFLRLKLE